MRESCQCGGHIVTFSYKRVLTWRETHIHEGRPEREPDKQGSTSSTERAWQNEPAEFHVGFRP